MNSLRPTNQKGMILLVFLLTIPFLILIATYYLRLSLTSFQVARFDQLHTEAQLAADAGADYAVEQISQNNSWTGTGGQVTLHSDSKLKTTYAVTVTNPDANTKTLQITGRTFWPLNTTTAARSVTIYVDLRPVSTGSFSIVSGEGGLLMSNSSKIVGGSVFINGEVSLSNTAQIGLSTNPVDVQVADEACPKPADANYPRVCTAADNAGQPITMNGPSTHIYGTVKATNQTNGSNMSNPGLTSGSVSPQALPTYNRASQKTAATNNMTGAAASCSGTQAINWPANTKITGDVTVGTKCKVTVLGNIWITGNLTLSNSAQLIVSNSLGSTQPVIMVDGSTGVTLNQSSQLVSNSSSTGFEVITFWNATGSPDASSVTGTNLANSRAVVTMALNNSSSAPNTVFYAYWSEVSVGNSGQIGALIGQTVNLNNNSAITFGSSISTGSVTWVVNGYRRH